MITVNAVGDICPIPVVKTKKALGELNGPGQIEVFVDNETAMKNEIVIKPNISPSHIRHAISGSI